MFDRIKKLFGAATVEVEKPPKPNSQPITEGDTKTNKKTLKTNSQPTSNPPAPKPKKLRKPKAKKAEPVLSAKEKATQAGEPYINILKIDIDPNDINNGAFDLDWNDKFVINLIKAGYKAKPDDTDADIVDRWFTQVCRNVVLEMYEQQQADPDNRTQMRVIQSKDLGDGRSEVS
jgi:hypothetical protein